MYFNNKMKSTISCFDTEGLRALKIGNKMIENIWLKKIKHDCSIVIY